MIAGVLGMIITILASIAIIAFIAFCIAFLLRGDLEASFSSLGFGLGLGFVLTFFLVAGNVNIEDSRTRHIAEREVLVLRLENIGEIKDPYLFSDVADFNGAIRDAEANIDNPWIDWFVDKSWLGVEPIETDDYLFMVGQMN